MSSVNRTGVHGSACLSSFLGLCWVGLWVDKGPVTGDICYRNFNIQRLIMFTNHKVLILYL